MKLPSSCQNALLYYIGITEAYPDAPNDKQAYNTINSLFYPNLTSEYARISEKKRLNPSFLKTPHITFALCANLLESFRLGGTAAGEQTVYRVERLAGYNEIKKVGHTISFTSTSKNGYLDAYTDKEGLVLMEFHLSPGAPRVDLIEMLPSYANADEAEILLPPNLPLSITERELTPTEYAIRDQNGNPPVLACTVTVNARDIETVDIKSLSVVDPDGAKAGIRVFSALNKRKKANPEDANAYIRWKNLFLRCLFALPLKRLLQVQIDEQRYITGYTMNIEDVFEKETAAKWILDLMGSGEYSSIANRVISISAERLTHTITTFLLGNAVREGLGLRFDSLPRILSLHAAGNSFNFFWSLICLFHDIGYCYEYRYKGDAHIAERTYMENADTRRKLLEFNSSYDLFSLTGDKIDKFNLTEEEKKWATDSLEMAKRYDLFRRDKHGVIDHGIAGALLLYNELMKIADDEAKKTSQLSPIYRGRASVPPLVQTGEMSANAHHNRFRSCVLLISLTVARHNMWNASSNNISECELYNEYGLDKLIDAKVDMKSPLNQMLFLLDYMDTIDPFKHFYTRLVEDDESTLDCNAWKEFILNKIALRLIPSSLSKDFHYLTFSFGDLPNTSPRKRTNRPNELFKKYCQNSKQMNNWLETAAAEYLGNNLLLSLPVVSDYSRTFPYDIKEEEIAALCLYEGTSDTSRPGLFYQIPNAYQTFNLLMMDGLTGEQVRIGLEKQKPYGLYIHDWPRMLKVFEDVFTAQCKAYATNPTIPERLYRIDRQVNTDMMIDQLKTIAFTSTSRVGYLADLAKPKHALTLLEIDIKEPIPLADYSAILREGYAYMSEEEVLLPPCLTVTFIEEILPSEKEKQLAENNDPKKYRLTLGTLNFPKETGETETNLRILLSNTTEQAANTLDYLSEYPQLAKNAKEQDYREYLSWKEAFKKLVLLRLGQIWMRFKV